MASLDPFVAQMTLSRRGSLAASLSKCAENIRVLAARGEQQDGSLTQIEVTAG